jgi:hypothetical protein
MMMMIMMIEHGCKLVITRLCTCFHLHLRACRQPHEMLGRMLKVRI